MSNDPIAEVIAEFDHSTVIRLHGEDIPSTRLSGHTVSGIANPLQAAILRAKAHHDESLRDAVVELAAILAPTLARTGPRAANDRCDSERFEDYPARRTSSVRRGIASTSATTTRPEKVTIDTSARRRVPTHSKRQTSSSPTLNATLRGGAAKTVTLDVRAPSEAIADFVRVWGEGGEICAHQLRHTRATLEGSDG